MGEDIILASWCDENHVLREPTIGCYKKMLAADPPERAAIAEMIFHRFHSRYIKPYLFKDKDGIYEKCFKNGFAMMASGCLLIEALESFRNGWNKTPKDEHGNELFDAFFVRETAFGNLKKRHFYKHVRCGILHQGETTGGFTVRKSGGDRLFDEGITRIYADKFLEALEESLASYRSELLTERWDAAVWDNFRRKMRFVIENCRRQPLGGSAATK